MNSKRKENKKKSEKVLTLKNLHRKVNYPLF